MMRLLFLIALLYAGSAFASPAGLWRVIGDRSGQAEAQVRISEHDGIFEGKITRVFPRPGVDPSALCELCPGDLKNRPVEGLTILTGMHREGDAFSGGEILDPDTGETYHCSMELSADGKKLVLRGYVMIPLFGRSQTWIRESGEPNP